MIKLKDGRYRERIGNKYFYGHSKAEVIRKIAKWRGDEEYKDTVSGVIEAWLEEKEEDVEYKTIEGYRAPIKRIKEAFGEQKIATLKPAQVQAFINGIARQGYKRTTVQRPLDILRMVCDYAIVTGRMYDNNPCNAVRLPNGLKQERRPLPDESVADVVWDSYDKYFGLFPFLLINTGLRRGEALALERTDFDFEAKTISVTKSIVWINNKPVVKAPKTKNSVRIIPLPDVLLSHMPQDWTGYLFSMDDDGKQALTDTSFRHRWERYCRESGLAWSEKITHVNPNNLHRYTKTKWHYDLTPHSLRHFYASICLDAGIEAKDTQAVMGHASVTTTMDIYTDILSGRKKATAATLNNYLKDRVSGRCQNAATP